VQITAKYSGVREQRLRREEVLHRRILLDVVEVSGAHDFHYPRFISSVKVGCHKKRNCFVENARTFAMPDDQW